MVKATAKEGRLRVSFPIQLVPGAEEQIVVCYLQLRRGGAIAELDIEYAGVLTRAKDSNLSAVNNAMPWQPTLTKTLAAQIRVGAMLEFWDCVAHDAKVMAMDEAEALSTIHKELAEFKDLLG